MLKQNPQTKYNCEQIVKKSILRIYVYMIIYNLNNICCIYKYMDLLVALINPLI